MLKVTHNRTDAPDPAGGRRAVDNVLAPLASRRGQAWIWAALALAGGLAVTLALHQQQQQRQHAQLTDEYVDLAGKGYVAVQAQLQSAEWLLRSVQTLFLASDQVTGDEFGDFYENLRPRSQFPSLVALAYAQRELRADGAHYVIALVQPRRGNEVLIGLDINTQPHNLTSLRLSEEHNDATMSAPFQLVNVGDGEAMEGITMRLPVFSPGAAPRTVVEQRARMQGSLALAFRVSPLIGDAFPADVQRRLDVRIIDVTDAGAASVLFDSGRVTAATRGKPLFDRTLAIQGRRWEISMWPRDGAAMSGAVEDPIWPAGVLISVLSAMLALLVATVRRRAIELAWRMSRRYRESEERFRALNELLPALVVLAEADDQGGLITYANQAARERFGEQLEHASLTALFEEGHLLLPAQQGEAGGSSRVDACLLASDGTRFWADVAISRIMLDGRATLLLVASDISEQRALNQLLSYQASHDTLTELYNRREFERRLRDSLHSMSGDTPFAALLYIDLDQFKLINDTSGHQAGDQLLMQLADVMVRQIGSADVLARLGGDEFGVLAFGVHDLAAAVAVAERLRRSVDGFVFIWEKVSYMISASIGGVLIDRPGMIAKDLLSQADTACYLAKESGRNRVHFYREQDDDTARRRGEMEWANRLRSAVEDRRLVLAYQEIRPLPLAAGAVITSVELLLRFREEDGRLVSPGVFIPAAERYGLMPMIDRWVVETALANFDQLHPSGARLGMAAINLSGASVEDDSLADLIVMLLQRHAIAPQRVCFEITETVAVRNLPHVARFMNRLRAVGCRISLDDFGAGMSSFTYLKNLPIDIIKIDGSFIRDMLVDPVSHAMVRAVTDIAHRLNLTVVAEWVSDAPTVLALTEMGVNYAQGFSLHEPELVTFMSGESARQ